MKLAGWGIVLMVLTIIVLRTRILLTLGNQLRALSDKLIVATLQRTSGFEAELKSRDNQGGQ
ncbi:hypothetical protein [Kallotenue papyrolyticum]|uniref:hypothetical protein n=1 Tax=Kallotenue papyrolyticum TaxID=1325125 RepID=UPI00047853BF|nr:hypothetical protein [Kallotenue papyrolyticum]